MVKIKGLRMEQAEILLNKLDENYKAMTTLWITEATLSNYE